MNPPLPINSENKKKIPNSTSNTPYNTQRLSNQSSFFRSTKINVTSSSFSKTLSESSNISSNSNFRINKYDNIVNSNKSERNDYNDKNIIFEAPELDNKVVIVNVIFRFLDRKIPFEFKKPSHNLYTDDLIDILYKYLREKFSFNFNKQDIVVTIGKKRYYYNSPKMITLQKISYYTSHYISSSFIDEFYTNKSSLSNKLIKNFKNNKSFIIYPNLNDLSEHIELDGKIPKFIIENEFCKIIFIEFIIIEELDFDNLILEYLKAGIDINSNSYFINKGCDAYFKIRDKRTEEELKKVFENIGVYLL